MEPRIMKLHKKQQQEILERVTQTSIHFHFSRGLSEPLLEGQKHEEVLLSEKKENIEITHGNSTYARGPLGYIQQSNTRRDPSCLPKWPYFFLDSTQRFSQHHADGITVTSYQPVREEDWPWPDNSGVCRMTPCEEGLSLYEWDQVTVEDSWIQWVFGQQSRFRWLELWDLVGYPSGNIALTGWTQQ